MWYWAKFSASQILAINLATFELSIQNEGSATVKLVNCHLIARQGYGKKVNFTVAGPLFCIECPNGRLWIILISIIMTVFVIEIKIICVKVMQNFLLFQNVAQGRSAQLFLNWFFCLSCSKFLEFFKTSPTSLFKNGTR